MRTVDTSVIANQQVVLSNREDHFLGPDLVVMDCDVVVDCAESRLSVVKTTFNSCSITITKRLKNYEWFGARFDNCSFQGELTGLRFGNFPDEVLESFGDVTNCSFESAVLHLTDFLNVDISSITFPRWPGFTVPEPSTHSDLLGIQWPGDLRLLFETIVESTSETTALSVHAPFAIRDLGGNIGTLKALLDRARNIIM